MKLASKQSSSASAPGSPRCTFTKANGHRCRMLPVPNSLFCPAHTPKPDPATELVRGLDRFETSGDVIIFLSRLLASVSKGEVSTRCASVLAKGWGFSFIFPYLLTSLLPCVFLSTLPPTSRDADA